MKENTKISPRNLLFPWLICILKIMNYVDISYLCESIIKRSSNRRAKSVSMYPMYVWMFICVYMYPYLPINICISLSYIHICFKSGKKWNQNQNCSHGKYEVKINGQNIFMLQSMSNQGRNASANNWLTVSVNFYYKASSFCWLLSECWGLFMLLALYDECKSEMPGNQLSN